MSSRRLLGLLVSLVLFGAACSGARDDEVMAQGPGWSITFEELVSSLEDEPPENLVIRDGVLEKAPATARLTNMIRLRLTANALTELGVEVDARQADADLRGAIEAARVQLTGQLRDTDPELLQSVSPYCLSAIVAETHEALADAQERLAAGEEFGAVADAINPAGATGPGGDIGCQPREQWAESIAAGVAGLQRGDRTAELELDANGTPVSLLVLVRDIDLANANIDPLMFERMLEYDVDVDAELGEWVQSDLAIRLG